MGVPSSPNHLATGISAHSHLFYNGGLTCCICICVCTLYGGSRIELASISGRVPADGPADGASRWAGDGGEIGVVLGSAPPVKAPRATTRTPQQKSRKATKPMMPKTLICYLIQIEKGRGLGWIGRKLEGQWKDLLEKRKEVQNGWRDEPVENRPTLT